MAELKFLSMAAILLFVASCAPTETSAAPSEVSLCEAKGGHMEKRGMMQSSMCVVPYADAGKTCSDSSQCLGKCLLNADNGSAERKSDFERATTSATPVTGSCEADDRTFGCIAEVKNGAVDVALCID